MALSITSEGGDLLLRIQDWPRQRLDDLLPHNWKRLMDAGELQPVNP